jgi:hypothetical protein
MYSGGAGFTNATGTIGEAEGDGEGKGDGFATGVPEAGFAAPLAFSGRHRGRLS